MTLRKLIDDLGIRAEINIGGLDNFSSIESLKIIKNISNSSNNWLIEYFTSDKFPEDIRRITESINRTISNHPKLNLELKNFFLLFTSTNELDVEVLVH